MVEHAAHNRGVAGSIPATATISDLAAALRRSGLLPEQGRVIAAVSGGADSTALLLLLCEARYEVTAAHYDHALRPGSESDAEFVAALCADLGVPLIRGVRSQPPGPGSLQAAARRLRYEFLESAAAGAACVALAHTADDAVEGAVLHLIRGSGLAGARGMPVRRGIFVRPLLGTWRVQLLACLAERGQDHVDDPSNLDMRYARVRVRRRLLPRLEADRPGIKARLHSAGVRLADLQEAAERAAALIARGGGFDLAAFAAASPVVQAQCLRRAYTAAGGADPGLGRRQLQAMARICVERRTGAGLDLPGGIRFWAGSERGEFVRTQAGSPPQQYRVTARRCSGCDATDAVHLRPGLRLAIGFRTSGLRMRPLGSPGSRKLQDILVDAKIPRWERDRMPLLFSEGRLAWVPGLAVEAELAAPPGSEAMHVTIDKA